jgi:hypothetical protein
MKITFHCVQQFLEILCQVFMRILIIIMLFVSVVACRRTSNCDNAIVYRSSKCGVEWEVEFQGQRYPVDSLPESLKRDKNSIFINQYHFYDDPRVCPCCGYRHLVVESAEEQMICI